MTAPTARSRRLNAHDVQSVVFSRTRMGRGYREDEVDAFLDLVAESLHQRDNDLSAARAEIQRVKNWRRERNIPDDGIFVPTPAEVHLYSRAQQEAERLVGRAQRVAAQLEREARDYCTQLVADAEAHAQAAVDEAQLANPNNADPNASNQRIYWHAFVRAMRVNLGAACNAFLLELERMAEEEMALELEQQQHTGPEGEGEAQVQAQAPWPDAGTSSGSGDATEVQPVWPTDVRDVRDEPPWWGPE